MNTLLNNKFSIKNFSNAWVIVLGCMLIQAVPFSIVASIQPQFISYVVEGEGFSLASFSLIFTIGTIASAIASPFIGVLFSKVNIKILYLLGCIISSIAFATFSICTELWQFYTVSCIVQIGATIISAIGIPVLISAWFDEESKGKALGFAFAGGSIGSIFLQPLAVRLLSTQGYSRSYLIFGIVALIVGIPVILFILRMPKDVNEKVKSKGKKKKASDTISPSVWGYTLKEAKKIKYFWIMTIGFIFVGIYVSSLSVQYPTYLRNYLNPILIGTVGSTFALFALIGNLFGGLLFDKFGQIKPLIISFVLVLIATLSLLLVDKSSAFAFVFAILKGLSVFAYMIGPAYLTGTFFGQKEFGSIYGIVQLIFAVGFALGSTLFGLLVDNFGYRFSWSIIILSVIIAYTLLIITSIGMKKLNKERLDKLMQ
ncbi:TPA: conjugated bile salt MFS transporter [Clostridioides difficile]|nr:transporter, Major Facilitator Superfamily (MFS) [Clostridioides difficile]VIG83808.1 transporter, Major Facilitator Superfamily (MFS) [Clostridioides difficile]HAU5070307.1 MFS transporter [Clostridioides difficile]HAU5231844.1 MFS transporter [Clostridioides difficile]HAU5259984.1 MFS transporter [Clostridioides difficile]